MMARTYQEISDFLGCAYRSVAYWCVHGDPDNLESLKDKREQGSYRKATVAYIELLMIALPAQAFTCSQHGPRQQLELALILK